MNIHLTKNKESQKLMELTSIFNRLFSESENTVLCSDAKEPLYKASTENDHAVIHSREDYLSSALHEIAHWSIAGKKRRELDDFGYWYEPEGRTKEQQLMFEKVEVKPQAVEWVLSLACNQPFYFSADNLSQAVEASECFKQSVYLQASAYVQNILPQRAHKLQKELIKIYRSDNAVSITELKIENA